MLPQPKIYYYDSVDSTNSTMKRLIATDELTEFSVVTASYQTGGRGQAGNSWESTEGENLLFSILFFPHFIAPEQLFILNMIVSVGVADVLNRYMTDVTVKWPNDIYAGDSKIAGILIENTLRPPSIDYSIAGIGLNVNQNSFAPGTHNAVSMKTITGESLNPRVLLSPITAAIARRYCECEQNGSSSIKTAYLKALYRQTGLFPFSDKNGRFMAEIKDVENSGNLLLVDDKGFERRYSFKEITFET